MALDHVTADRLAAWFEENPPPWADQRDVIRRAPACLAIAVARGSGYSNREVGEAFFLAPETAKTYHRDTAAGWCMSHVQLQRAAVAHVAALKPELLVEILTTNERDGQQ